MDTKDREILFALVTIIYYLRCLGGKYLELFDKNESFRESAVDEFAATGILEFSVLDCAMKAIVAHRVVTVTIEHANPFLVIHFEGLRKASKHKLFTVQNVELARSLTVVDQHDKEILVNDVRESLMNITLEGNVLTISKEFLGDEIM